MLQEPKYIYKKGSIRFIMAVWSLFFLLTTSCQRGTSEQFNMARQGIMLMDSCRLKADNMNFYLHKYEVEKILDNYENDFTSLTSAEQQDLTSLKAQYTFATVDYLLQIGNRKEARRIINDFADNATINLYADSTQWLNYLYHQGKVCYIPYDIDKNARMLLRGYDCLIQCYILSTRRKAVRYEILSMQMLSQYFLHPEFFPLAREFDAPSIRYINEDDVPDEMLAGNLAERALGMSLETGDPSLTDDSWRYLAQCYFQIGDAVKSLECLHTAMANPATESMPDMKARLAEQLSMSYAAIDDKYNSDTYRNLYLDLQDSTRQDRQFEARAYHLKEATDRIWMLVTIASAVFLLLLFTIMVLTRMRKKRMQHNAERETEVEELNDTLQLWKLQLSNAQRSAVEQRARIAVINSILPLIDRMKLAAKKAQDSTDVEEKERSLEYVREIATDIERQNDMLTSWIKMQHGSIKPRIETIQMQEIMSLIGTNAPTLLSQGIRLVVPETDICVKADKSLTVFLLNTLTDNARKAMPNGGVLTIECSKNEAEKYAEISVSDTGVGMTTEQTEHAFDYRPMTEEEEQPSVGNATPKMRHYGFGLQNCRGIIDRYRKISSIFSVCSIKAESEIGKGTTISFRLPLVAKILLCLLTLCLNLNARTDIGQGIPDALPTTVRHTDSLYQCNVTKRYSEAIVWADSCINDLKTDTLANDYIKLEIYNETAIAALAMHQWQKYKYFNYLYTNLYKETTADKSLPDYCRLMEQGELWANITMLIVLLLLLSLVPIFWFFYLRHVVRYRNTIAQRIDELNDTIAITQAEHSRLHVLNNIIDNQLSIVKHETMYYPARILQIVSGNKAADSEDSSQSLAAISYYRDLYAMLTTQVLSSSVDAYQFPIKKCQLAEAFPGIMISSPDSIAQEGTDNISDSMTEDGKSSESKYVLLVNPELITLLRLLLKRHNGGKSPAYRLLHITKGYAYIEVSMPQASALLAEAASSLFTPSTPDVDFLVMRQILRETGAATNRYACGIKASVADEDAPRLTITFSLPTSAYNNY